MTITLNDKGYKWLPTNTANGIWRKDATATVGYEPVGSQFTIQYGYVLADESEELLSLFVGLIHDDPAFDSQSGVVNIVLVGQAESKLETSDAQLVGTTVTDQATSPATGDASRTNFSLQQKSTWNAANIRKAAVVKTQGTDFTLDKLNNAENAAEINFVVAPGNLEAILADLKLWYRDQSISTLVGYLCDQAGITAGNRNIEEPNWPSISVAVPYGTKAQWDAATKSKANSEFVSGWVQLGRAYGFESGLFAPEWVVTALNGSATVQNGGADLGDYYASLSVSPSTRAIVQWSGSPTAPARADFATGTFRDLVGVGNPSWTANDMQVVLGAVSYPHFIFYDQNSLDHYVVLSLQDASPAGNCRIFFKVKGSTTVDIDSLKIVDIDNAAVIETPEIDLGAIPSSWQELTYTATLNGGTISIRTKGATSSGGVYGSYAALGAGNIPASELRRYIKVEITFTSTAVGYGPEMDVFNVNYATSSLTIKSADFTGLTCLQAVAELAKMSNMEFGTAGDGTFFFRNKAVSITADLVISQKNVVSSVTSYFNGYRDVKTIGQCRYGRVGTDGYYFAQYKASDAGEASPTTAAKFGDKVLSLEIQKFLFSANADFATAIARLLYEQNYRPKRKLKIKCRIIPHLDLSDKVRLSFHDSPLIEKAIFGDPLQHYPVTGPNSRTLARDIVMKVVGHTADIMRGTSDLDLEEVLS